MCVCICVCVCVYIYIYIYIYMCRVMEPRSPTICCLQAREPGRQWCNSVRVQRPETQGSQWFNSQSQSFLLQFPKSKGRKSGSSNVQGQEKIDIPDQKERWNLPFLCLFCSVGPSTGWMMPTHFDESHLLHLVY